LLNLSGFKPSSVWVQITEEEYIKGRSERMIELIEKVLDGIDKLSNLNSTNNAECTKRVQDEN